MSQPENKSGALEELADQRPILSRLAVACHATCAGDHHVPDCSSASSATAALHTLTVRQAEKLAALEAELARLKPSGQVAEDERRLSATLFDSDNVAWVNHDGLQEARELVSRLAAKAQGYEDAVAEQERLKTIAEQADTERGFAQKQTQHERSLKDAAVADNAALLKIAAPYLQCQCGRARAAHGKDGRVVDMLTDGHGMAWGDGEVLCSGFLEVTTHPGAALLERLLALEDVVGIFATAGWGGTLAGLAALRSRAQGLVYPKAHDPAATPIEQPKEITALTASLAAMREHAQMLYECAPPTNGQTSCEHNEQWEKAKRLHHELMGQLDAGAELLTELNDHRRNIEVLRGELGAKDHEHAVDAFHRVNRQLLSAIKKFAAYVRTRSGHEQHCRGWRNPVKDKSAPFWKRRGEWMDLERCTCGPGELLRLAGEILQ